MVRTISAEGAKSFLLPPPPSPLPTNNNYSLHHSLKKDTGDTISAHEDFEMYKI